jgi:hypothetical protein
VIRLRDNLTSCKAEAGIAPVVSHMHHRRLPALRMLMPYTTRRTIIHIREKAAKTANFVLSMFSLRVQRIERDCLRGYAKMLENQRKYSKRW